MLLSKLRGVSRVNPAAWSWRVRAGRLDTRNLISVSMAMVKSEYTAARQSRAKRRRAAGRARELRDVVEEGVYPVSAGDNKRVKTLRLTVNPGNWKAMRVQKQMKR